MRKIIFHITVLFFIFTGLICGGGGQLQVPKTKITATHKGTYDTLKSNVKGKNLYGVHYLNPSQGFIVGGKGTILKTTNGVKWDTIVTPHTMNLYGVFLTENVKAVIAVGENYTILRSTDLGVSWTKVDSGGAGSGSFRGVNFANKDEGVAVGDSGKIKYTVDGGIKWLDLPHGLPNVPDLRSVSLEDLGSQNYKLVIVGEKGAVIYNKLRTYKDSLVLINLPSDRLNSVSMVKGTMAGYTACKDGRIFYTDDYGHNWKKVFSTPNALNGIHAPSTTLVYAVGEKGTVARYTKKTDWAELTPPTSKNLNWVDPNEWNPTATCVGDEGEIYLINPPIAPGASVNLETTSMLCQWKVSLKISSGSTPGGTYGPGEVTGENPVYDKFRICSRTPFGRMTPENGDGLGSGWIASDDAATYYHTLYPLVSHNMEYTFTVVAPTSTAESVDGGYLSFYMLDADNNVYLCSSYSITCTP